MKIKLQGINSQAFFNILSTVLTTGINVITLSIFTRLLGAENYGKYSIYSTWVSLFSSFMSLQLGSCLSVARYDYKHEYNLYNKNNLLLGTFVSVFVILIGFLFKDGLSKILGYPPYIVILMFVNAFISFITGYYSSILIYDKKTHINFIISLATSTASILLSILFIKYIKFEELYIGRVIGSIIPGLITAIIIWIAIFIKGKGKLKIEHWKYSLAYGLPLVLHIISHDILSQSNKLMLKYMGIGDTSVGLYSYYSNLVSVLSIIIVALNTSWVPFYFDDLNANDIPKIRKRTKDYMELVAVLTIGFILLSREVAKLFSSNDFWREIDIIPLLVLPIYIMYMYQFPVNFEYYNKKTIMISIGTICSGVTNILCNFILIPKYGMYGSAISTIISYIVLFVVHFVIANNIKEMKFHVKLSDYCIYFVLVMISIAIFYLFKESWIIRWLIGIFIGLYELIKIIKRKTIF